MSAHTNLPRSLEPHFLQQKTLPSHGHDVLCLLLQVHSPWLLGVISKGSLACWLCVALGQWKTPSDRKTETECGLIICLLYFLSADLLGVVSAWVPPPQVFTHLGCVSPKVLSVSWYPHHPFHLRVHKPIVTYSSCMTQESPYYLLPFSYSATCFQRAPSLNALCHLLCVCHLLSARVLT